MLKKFGAILIVLILVVSLAACNRGTTPTEPAEVRNQPETSTETEVETEAEAYDETEPETFEQTDAMVAAYEMYSQILQRLSFGDQNPSGAFDVDIAMEIEMSMDGEVLVMTSTGNMQTIVDGENMKSVMVMETDMGELGSMDMEMYMVIEDNVLTEFGFYMDGMDMSAFIPMEVMQEMMDDTLNIPVLEMEGLLSAEITEIAGNTVVNLVLDGQMYTEFMMDIMGSMLDGMLEELGSMDFAIEVDDIAITIVVDSNDNPVSMTMEMHMQMEIDGETLVMSSITEYTFNAFDDDVEIAIAA